MSRIMIIDDLKENLGLLDKTLSKQGYDIRVFNNPMIALKAIANSRPDLILLDINMPQMNGFEVCIEIKKDNKAKSIPIIFLTAQDDKESKIKAFNYGGVDYITKPFIMEELCARVETHIKISSLQRELQEMNEILEEKVKLRTKELENELQIRRETEKKLQIAKEEAENANRAKTMFLANVSHELRTPLNGIVGITEILKSSTITEELKEFLEYQIEAEETMIKLVEDLLNIEKIETDKVELQLSKMNLKESIKREILMIESRAEKKEIEVYANIEEEIPEILIGDEEKVCEVISQLLNNALKFTEKGSIGIEVKKREENKNSITIEFSIQDTGIGIGEEEKIRLFQIFSQGDGSYTKNYQGMGLGLMISIKMVEAMGGELDYSSEKGKGSRFYFILTFAKQ